MTLYSLDLETKWKCIVLFKAVFCKFKVAQYIFRVLLRFNANQSPSV